MNHFTYSNINENKLWIEEKVKLLEKNLHPKVDNYSDFFKKIQNLLKYGDLQDKYYALTVSDKMLDYYFNHQSTEFDFINNFNSILPELILFLGESNVFNNQAERMFSRYVKHHDNVEFLLKFLLTQGLNDRDVFSLLQQWKIRFNCLVVLSMVFKDKHDFFVDKKPFTVKLIELLIIHSKDKANKIGVFSSQLLIEIIGKLPNYNEINKLLPIESISEIERILSHERTNSLNVIKQTMAAFRDNLSKKSIIAQEEKIKEISEKFGFEEENKEFSEYDIRKDPKLKLKEFITKIKGRTEFHGIMFGVFPKNLIEETDPDVSYENRIRSFERISSIFNENFKNEAFQKFCPSFFSFISCFINDKYNNISLIAIEIINKIVGKVAGIDLLVDLPSIIPNFAVALARLNSSITLVIKELFDKLMMVIPTSKLIPHLLKFLAHPNWVVISDALDILLSLFKNLKSINNDIDFENNDYEINLILPILGLLRHGVPKVVSTTKKIILHLTDNIVKKSDFLKTLKLIISESLYEEIAVLIRAEEIYESHQNPQLKSYDFSKILEEKKIKVNDHYQDILVRKNLNKPLEELNKNLDIDNDENKADKGDNLDKLKIFKRLARYQGIDDNEEEDRIPINVDENYSILKTPARTPHKLNNKIEIIMQNYSNYKANSPKVKDVVNRSRLKRYNDPSDHELESVYDMSYNYSIKQKETLSPPKNPENLYFKIYDLLRSNLNWEKQFKAIDNIRKILYYSQNLIFQDNYYFNLIVEELISLLNNLRTSLVRNSLFALNEVFEIKDVPITSKYDLIMKTVIKKMIDKNEFISKESQTVMTTFVENCEVNKALSVLLSLTQSNYSNTEFVKVCILTFIKFIRKYKNEVVKTRTFVGLMSIITEAFNKSGYLKKEIKLFLREMQSYYDSKDKFTSFIRKYFSEDSYQKVNLWLQEKKD